MLLPHPLSPTSPTVSPGKISKLTPFKYTPNALAESLGVKIRGEEYGLSAQHVQKQFPELVRLSEMDEDAHGESLSGQNYLTIDYARLTTVLLQAVKELTKRIEDLEKTTN